MDEVAAGPVIEEPALLSEEDKLYYSKIYRDDGDIYEYMYVILPARYKQELYEFSDLHLIVPSEMRARGITIDPGWQNQFLWRPPRQPGPVLVLRRSLTLPRESLSLDNVSAIPPPPDPNFNPIPSRILGLLDAPAGPASTEELAQKQRDNAGISSLFDSLDRMTAFRV